MTNITKKEKEFMKSKAKTKKVSKKRVRAKDSKGRFIADDPNTPNINEAYGEKPAPNNNILGIILAVLLIAALLFLGGK